MSHCTCDYHQEQNKKRQLGEECECAKMSCEDTCLRDHTHKTFSCRVCDPLVEIPSEECKQCHSTGADTCDTCGKSLYKVSEEKKDWEVLRDDLIDAQAEKLETWGLQFNDDDYVSFLHEQLKKREEEVRRETLKELILEYQNNELDGKGYDFYFAIRSKLDDIISIIEKRV